MLKKGQKKFFVILIFFYFLAMIQSSFLGHFAIRGVSPNLILITVLLLILFERPKSHFGKVSGFLAGFYLDIFSSFALGVATFSLGLTGLISKRVLQQFKRINFLLVFCLFVFAALVYEFLIPFFDFLFKLPSEGLTPLRFPLNYSLLINVLYNSFLGLLVFLLFKTFRKRISRCRTSGTQV